MAKNDSMRGTQFSSNEERDKALASRFRNNTAREP